MRELMGEQPSPFPVTMRAKPRQWEEDVIKAAFDVSKTGLPLLPKGDNRLGSYFTGHMDPKEGWFVEQCNNQELIRVFWFLKPILHLEKHKRVIMRMGNMIVVALFKNQKFNWASIIQELLVRQLSALGGKKGICLLTYLFHLYWIKPALTIAKREEVDISDRRDDQVRVRKTGCRWNDGGDRRRRRCGNPQGGRTGSNSQMFEEGAA